MWISRTLSCLLALLVMSSLGCIEHALVESLERENELAGYGDRGEPTEGAIWRGGSHSGSFLYYDRKARGLGDLVTVRLVEDLSAEGTANTSTSKNSSILAQISSDVGLTMLTAGLFNAVVGIFGFGDGLPGQNGQTLEVANANTSTSYDGEGETTRESSFTGTVTCRVIQELGGGLLRIRGKRELIVNHELQLVTVSGLVRRADISIDNTVPSTQLAEAKLTFDGLGVLDDKQRPPLFARVMDWIYPF